MEGIVLNFHTEPNQTQRINVQSIIIMSVFIATTIVFSRMFSYSVWNMRIGLSFLPVVVSAIVLGPLRTAVVSGFADCIGAILFPAGTYFAGFTVTAVFVGILYGLMLYKRLTIPRIFIAVGIHQLVLSLVLNTYWLSVLYQTPFITLFTTRLLQTGIMVVVEIVVIIALVKTLGSFLSKKALQYIRSSEANLRDVAADRL